MAKCKSSTGSAVKGLTLKVTQVAVAVWCVSCADMRRDIQEIFRATPHSKQVMMFSATLCKDIRPVCKKFMQDVIITLGWRRLPAPWPVAVCFDATVVSSSESCPAHLPFDRCSPVAVSANAAVLTFFVASCRTMAFFKSESILRGWSSLILIVSMPVLLPVLPPSRSLSAVIRCGVTSLGLTHLAGCVRCHLFHFSYYLCCHLSDWFSPAVWLVL